jgi:hypothetical protein
MPCTYLHSALYLHAWYILGAHADEMWVLYFENPTLTIPLTLSPPKEITL